VTFASFSDVFVAARAKSDAGDRESALALLNGRERTFPLSAGLIHSSRAALLTELDRAEAALDELDQALAAGCRYRAEWLRDDGRLAPLRANPRFEKIIERAMEMKTGKKPGPRATALSTKATKSTKTTKKPSQRTKKR